MKKIEVNFDIKSDTKNLSKATLVFDSDNASEVFKAFRKAEASVESIMKQRGIITEEGYSVAEFTDYIHYIDLIAVDIEQHLRDLYKTRERVRLSPVEETDEMCSLIQANIDELWNTADKFYSLFGKDITHDLKSFEDEVMAKELIRYKVEPWIGLEDEYEADKEVDTV